MIKLGSLILTELSQTECKNIVFKLKIQEFNTLTTINITIYQSIISNPCIFEELQY